MEERRQISVEELFRQKLENAEVIPGESVNNQLMRRLSAREFLRFNPSRFNIYYAALIAAGLITAIALLFSSPSRDENKAETPSLIDQHSQVIPAPSETPATSISGNSGSDQAVNLNAPVRRNTMQQAEKEPVAEIRKAEEIIAPAGIDKSITKNLNLTEVSSQGTLQTKPAGNPALFMPSVTTGCAPLKVHFDNLADSYSSFSWSFGDGGSSDEKEPDWIYDAEGEYKAVLEAKDEGGRISSWTVIIRVSSSPKAMFELSPAKTGLQAGEARFINYSTGASYYKWDFGDGNVSSSFEPVHKYSGYGDYNVSLVAYSESGCSDTALIGTAFTDSQYFISMPNAFIPNPQGPSGGIYSATSDETAEIFHPSFSGVTEFQMRIFGKTGIVVFETNDINVGWDGYFKGQLCNPGVYIWKIRGNFSNGESFTRSGDLTLLRK